MDVENTCLRAFIPQRMKVWAFQILTLYSSNFLIGGEDPYDTIGREKNDSEISWDSILIDSDENYHFDTLVPSLLSQPKTADFNKCI